MKINSNFDNLVPNYLFAEIAKRVSDYQKNNPEKDIIRLGIGDVTLPLAPVVVEALKKGSEELGVKETFKGYPDYEGYEFVRQAIADYYGSFGVKVSADEILISDGAKSDCGNICDIFSKDNIVLVTDPVYPVYVDSNIMSGRKIIYADCNKDNNFTAMPDDSVHADIIYLCSPNNPTGAAYTLEQLKIWVNYALKNDAVILYDSAYEAFISDDLPRSIFAVAKFNGVSWPVQCAAAAVFSDEGQKQIKENLSYYKENAKIIAEALDDAGIYYTGGKNSPYIWLECPNGMGSWEFFDLLLEKANVVGTPGAGFGKNGEGFFRLTSFGDREKTIEAVKRLKNLLNNI